MNKLSYVKGQTVIPEENIRNANHSYVVKASTAYWFDKIMNNRYFSLYKIQ